MHGYNGPDPRTAETGGKEPAMMKTGIVVERLVLYSVGCGVYLI